MIAAKLYRRNEVLIKISLFQANAGLVRHNINSGNKKLLYIFLYSPNNMDAPTMRFHV